MRKYSLCDIRHIGSFGAVASELTQDSVAKLGGLCQILSVKTGDRQLTS